MANDKKITIDWSEIDQTLYGIIRRESTGEFLDDVTGTFATTATDIYVSLVEDGTVRGRYEVTENRTVWPDGQYLTAVYKQDGGSPSTSADQIIGSGKMDIVNDNEVSDVLNSTVEGSFTLTEMIRIMFAALAGESTGGGTTTITFRNAADDANRITATVDNDGNRTNMNLDGS